MNRSVKAVISSEGEAGIEKSRVLRAKSLYVTSVMYMFTP